MSTIVTEPLNAQHSQDHKSEYTVTSYLQEGAKAPNTHYIGEAWLNSLLAADGDVNYNISKANFKKNSTLDWHKHATAQVLIYLEGEGYYQERGKKPVILKAGDVIKCKKEVEHWHSSTKYNDVTYLALYGGKQPTIWTEALTQNYYDSVANVLQTRNSKSIQNTNPFTLVYDGAIKENIKGKVNIHPVTYKLNGIDIAANVYTPANYDPLNKYHAVVVAHPNGGIKEQTAGLYAQRLAEQGFITITADAAYQGASGGEPRHTDKPANRIEDIHGMADFISQYTGVDTSKIGLLGICGGGGYSLKAAQSDKRFKAIATLSMFNSGEVRRNGFQNAQINTIQQRLKQASDARALEVAAGKTLYSGVASITDEEIAKTTTDLYREGYQYYYRTHTHPNSTFLYTTSSLMELMTWDATDQIELINQPLLMIAGSKADTKYMTDEAFKKATNANSKELFLINGATHIQTYWKPEYVAQAVNKLATFYQTNL